MTASTLRVESHIAARAKKLHAFLWFVVEIRPLGASCKQVFVFIDATAGAACIAELGDEKGPHAPFPALNVSDYLCLVLYRRNDDWQSLNLAEQKGYPDFPVDGRFTTYAQ